MRIAAARNGRAGPELAALYPLCARRGLLFRGQRRLSARADHGVCGIGHGILGYLAAGHSRYVPVLIAGLPFALAGLLIIAAWWLREAASD